MLDKLGDLISEQTNISVLFMEEQTYLNVLKDIYERHGLTFSESGFIMRMKDKQNKNRQVQIFPLKPKHFH